MVARQGGVWGLQGADSSLAVVPGPGTASAFQRRRRSANTLAVETCGCLGSYLRGVFGFLGFVGAFLYWRKSTRAANSRSFAAISWALKPRKHGHSRGTMAISMPSWVRRTDSVKCYTETSVSTLSQPYTARNAALTTANTLYATRVTQNANKAALGYPSRDCSHANVSVST
jgi:hypothetical protein